jgi:DNA-binding NtrC family response regulator
LETESTAFSSYYLQVLTGNPIARGFRMSFPAKVLIVEDDNAMAQMCAKLIRRRGHTALITGSGWDAVTMVREAGDIDVVISDVHMPQMTGVQLLKLLRAIDSKLPVILITGFSHLLGPTEAFELGVTDYILKPFEPEVLMGSVERAANSGSGV